MDVINDILTSDERSDFIKLPTLSSKITKHMDAYTDLLISRIKLFIEANQTKQVILIIGAHRKQINKFNLNSSMIKESPIIIFCDPITGDYYNADAIPLLNNYVSENIIVNNTANIFTDYEYLVDKLQFDVITMDGGVNQHLKLTTHDLDKFNKLLKIGGVFLLTNNDGQRYYTSNIPRIVRYDEENDRIPFIQHNQYISLSVNDALHTYNQWINQTHINQIFKFEVLLQISFENDVNYTALNILRPQLDFTLHIIKRDPETHDILYDNSLYVDNIKCRTLRVDDAFILRFFNRSWLPYNKLFTYISYNKISKLEFSAFHNVLKSLKQLELPPIEESYDSCIMPQSIIRFEIALKDFFKNFPSSTAAESLTRTIREIMGPDDLPFPGGKTSRTPKSRKKQNASITPNEIFNF